jgi:pimeloyl-ACP methyl ester carboxylesterase
VNDVGELKEFAIVHARAQNIPDYRRLLDGIRTDDGDAPGSWVSEWSRVAEDYAARGRHLEACRHYNMARFPFVDGPARQQALDRCVDAFDQWRRSRGKDIERLDLEFGGVGGGRVRGWASGLSPRSRLPLLLIMGGIVTIKEQWAPALASIRRLGVAAVVTEMPGVGENTLRYSPQSAQMLSRLLDAVGDRADVSSTYALTLSFSGHMALRCAVDDPRIRGVVTAAAPIREFFADEAWQRRLPRITVDTLSHLTGTKPAEVVGQFGDWALTAGQIADLDVPVYYMASGRDEIIPPGEVELLRRHVRELHLLEHDDVHGAPAHTTESRLWAVWSVLRMREALPVQRAAIRVLLGALRLRGRLARSAQAYKSESSKNYVDG